MSLKLLKNVCPFLHIFILLVVYSTIIISVLLKALNKKIKLGSLKGKVVCDSMFSENAVLFDIILGTKTPLSTAVELNSYHQQSLVYCLIPYR